MKKNIIQEKSFSFSLQIISVYKNLIKEKEYILSKQLLRSATSLGANIEEAIAGSSGKDFKNKMSIALKEARETKYWLLLLKKGNLTNSNIDAELMEINDIINILYKIVKTTSQNQLNLTE